MVKMARNFLVCALLASLLFACAKSEKEGSDGEMPRIDGKRATVFSSERAKLEAEGAIYTGKNVEVDGKIITANGPNAAAEFAKAIVKALQ